MTFHYRYRKQILLGIIIFIIISSITTFSIYKYLKDNKHEEVKENKELVVKKKKEEEKVEEKILLSIDIKGEVNTPGIYQLEEGSRVIDAINKAGGLTENANTTVINLSKKIKDEMVIIIYSNYQVEEFSKTKEIEKQVIDNCNQIDENSLHNDACIDTNNNILSNNKVNINTATLEELMTLEGVGESKAKSIIEYRNNNPFNSIEDIKNVSGIGDNLFDKIKENITTE